MSETVTLIKKCARFQARLISRNSLEPTRELDESHLIASCLRLLVLTYELSLVDGNLPGNAFGNGEIHHSLRRFNRLDPAIEVTRLVEAEQAASSAILIEDKETLPKIVGQLVRTMQHTLFRRKPKKWPWLLCSLCILDLAVRAFYFDAIGLDFTECVEATETVIHTLCDMFDICSKRNHPLSDIWNEEVYARSTEYDSNSMECFRWFSDQWQEGKWISYLSFRAMMGRF